MTTRLLIEKNGNQRDHNYRRVIIIMNQRASLAKCGLFLLFFFFSLEKKIYIYIYKRILFPAIYSNENNKDCVSQKMYCCTDPKNVEPRAM